MPSGGICLGYYIRKNAQISENTVFRNMFYCIQLCITIYIKRYKFVMHGKNKGNLWIEKLIPTSGSVMYILPLGEKNNYLLGCIMWIH